jgi:cyclase
MKKGLIIIGGALLLIICVIVVVGRNGYSKFMEVTTIPVDKNLTVFEGGGGNSIVLTSDDGKKTLIVDTKMDAAAKALAANIKGDEITIVNTHFHRDHVGGNNLFPHAKIIAGAYTPQQWMAMAPSCKYPDQTLKPGEEDVFKIGAETVHVRNMGRAHTWNDVVVYLENRKFLVVGDVVFNHRHPALFAHGGTNIASWVNVLDSLLGRFKPATVLPGHGPLSDTSAIVDQKDYFLTIMSAIGSPEKLSAAKTKFKNYSGIPMLTDFDKTVKFLKKED